MTFLVASFAFSLASALGISEPDAALRAQPVPEPFLVATVEDRLLRPSEGRFRISSFDEHLSTLHEVQVGDGPVFDVDASARRIAVASYDAKTRRQWIEVLDASLRPLCSRTALSDPIDVAVVHEGGFHFLGDGRIAIEVHRMVAIDQAPFSEMQTRIAFARVPADPSQPLALEPEWTLPIADAKVIAWIGPTQLLAAALDRKTATTATVRVVALREGGAIEGEVDLPATVEPRAAAETFRHWDGSAVPGGYAWVAPTGVAYHLVTEPELSLVATVPFQPLPDLASVRPLGVMVREVLGQPVAYVSYRDVTRITESVVLVGSYDLETGLMKEQRGYADAYQVVFDTTGRAVEARNIPQFAPCGDAIEAKIVLDAPPSLRRALFTYNENPIRLAMWR